MEGAAYHFETVFRLQCQVTELTEALAEANEKLAKFEPKEEKCEKPIKTRKSKKQMGTPRRKRKGDILEL